MQIVKVTNNWNPKVLRIELNIGNVCNYKCWYCFPGSNEGNYKFPNIDILKKNIPHLINYYKEHLGKEIFEIEFVGGEPTHWPKLLDFIKFLKEHFNCLITMTTNGSKKLEWWKDAVQYFDRITLSCHHQYVNKEEFRNLGDLLYKNNVLVSSSVMMDPNEWEKCISLIDYLKKSKYSWTIRYADIIGHGISYSKEQQTVLTKYRARRANIFWFLKNNKYYVSNVKITNSLGKTKKVNENELILKNLNVFTGWKCNVGVDWIVINMDGTMSGTCGQMLFGRLDNFNFYADSFVTEFNPTLVPAICNKSSCNCTLESNMKKIIPIYENRY